MLSFSKILTFCLVFIIVLYLSTYVTEKFDVQNFLKREGFWYLAHVVIAFMLW